MLFKQSVLDSTDQFAIDGDSKRGFESVHWKSSTTSQLVILCQKVIRLINKYIFFHFIPNFYVVRLSVIRIFYLFTSEYLFPLFLYL